MADFGVSFVPGGSEDQQKPLGPTPEYSGPPVQQAIKLLSLRLPRFSGPGAIAPGSLLHGQGAAGLAGGPGSLAEVLRMLFGQSQGAGPGGPMGLPGGSPLPGPRVSPGSQFPVPNTPPPPDAGGFGGFRPPPPPMPSAPWSPPMQAPMRSPLSRTYEQ